MAKGTMANNVAVSSNWMALKQRLPGKRTHKPERTDDPPRKRRKLYSTHPSAPEPSDMVQPSKRVGTGSGGSEDVKDGASPSLLRRMILGEMDYSETQRLPGKYLALDCEMVGVGTDGIESSLARVSVVNFYGVVLMDEFVRQRERVVDYRTQYSGVRASDLVKAKPFDQVQKQVADLLKDRILVGHAVHHDLKALLLSHPRQMTRDTQYYAWKYKVVKSKYVALRNLVKQEIGVTIQSGEHSSVTDARATMAVYRSHQKVWEKSHNLAARTKRKRDKQDDTGEDKSVGETGSEFPGGGRKGVSSGLSTVVRRVSAGGEKKKWWKQLAGGARSEVV